MSQPIILTKDMSAILNSLSAQYFRKVTKDSDGNETISVLETTDLSNLADFGNAYNDLSENEREAFNSDMITLVTTQIFKSNIFTGSGIDITVGLGDPDYNGIIQVNRMRRQKLAETDTSTDPKEGAKSNDLSYNGFDVESLYFANPLSEKVVWSLPHNAFKGMLKDENALLSFIAMINQNIETEIKLHFEAFTFGLINANIGAVLTDGQEEQKVNLLAKYLEKFPDATTTVDTAFTDRDFLIFANSLIDDTVKQMKHYNTFNNIAKYESETNMNTAHVLFNSSFITHINNYSLADTYNIDYRSLPKHREVYAWQSPTQPRAIDITTKTPKNNTPIDIKQDGIIGIIMGDNACKIYDKKIETFGKFDIDNRVTNYVTHIDANSMIDYYENAVVFYIEDIETP